MRLAAQLTTLALVLTAGAVQADDHQVELGDYQIQVDSSWERREPQSRILAAEFAAPGADKTAEGRFTVSSAGGGVEANLQRWIGQFTQPDGKPSSDQAKTEEKTVAGQKIHLLDISGTYRDQKGPMAPVVERENYRMLAAIVLTKDGQYFLKLYGPRETIAKQESAFARMIDSLSAR